jgi:glycosyltransferase involved in cell wall biosynthesis
MSASGGTDRQDDRVVDVILPALNEAAALPQVLERLPVDYRAIVVDNGSSDGTADVARELGAYVVDAPVPGYGSAVHAGLVAATSEVVAVMDADGSLDAAELPTLVQLVVSGAADLAMGRRRPTARGAWPWHARQGNKLLAHRINRTVHTHLADIGPMRVFGRQPMLELDVTDRRFGYPFETVVRAARAGWRIVEVDVSYGPRASGTTSKVTGTVRGTARALRDFQRVVR